MELNEIVNDFKNIKSRNYKKVWEPFMRKYKCDRICELGVFEGDNFMEMIAHTPQLAVAIDSWKNDGVHTLKDASYSNNELHTQYNYFLNKVKNIPFVQIIRDSTSNASKKFPDNWFDFVYIDADHSFDACYLDLLTWYPKVKKSKFLMGHDYRRGFGVVEAVNKFVKENKLDLLFLSPSTWGVIKK